MTAVEQEGRALRDFVRELVWKLSALADHPTTNAVVPEVSDALDDYIRGMERGLLRAIRKAMVASDVNDPFVAQWEKIMGEVLVSYQTFGTALIASYSTWLSRRLDELYRGARGDRESEVERGLGHGAG